MLKSWAFALFIPIMGSIVPELLDPCGGVKCKAEARRRKRMSNASTTTLDPPAILPLLPVPCYPSHCEAPICAAGVKKLRDEGWRVVCEVWQFSRPMDVVATRDGKMLVMEAKTRLTAKLKHQIRQAELSADLAIVIIGGRARQSGVAWCREHKIGLWCVNENVVTEIVAPEQIDPMPYYNKQLLECLEQYERLGDTSPGGLPCQKGVGTAQWVQAAVDEYKGAHPNATWKEIHAAVPSHYATAKNMYSALRSNKERLAFRARVKTRRMENRESVPENLSK